MKSRTQPFDKFITRKKNSAIKEQFRQEKKADRIERSQAIERHFAGKRKGVSPKSEGPATPEVPKNGSMPLNKFIAHCGVCSRREAAQLVRDGKVSVNNQAVLDPGSKVRPADLVKLQGKKISITPHFVYILLNKPKDYITTTKDPQGRKTVLQLIRAATPERVYPVGRLDRNSSGVLLLTNDGSLAQKLAHPRHEVKKIYHVTLDKPLAAADAQQILDGVKLEDGLAKADDLGFPEAQDRAQVGVELHSGKNRIVRRIFEELGYRVKGLDRVMYAGLSKKNIQRGHWRLLTDKEVRLLKFLNAASQ